MVNPPEIFLLAAPASVTILSAKAFAADLLNACHAHQHIRLDLSAVAQADLSFVQTVHAARIFAQEQGGTLTLAQPAGDILTHLLNAAGFSHGDSDADFWFNGALSK